MLTVYTICTNDHKAAEICLRRLVRATCLAVMKLSIQTKSVTSHVNEKSTYVEYCISYINSIIAKAITASPTERSASDKQSLTTPVEPGPNPPSKTTIYSNGHPETNPLTQEQWKTKSITREQPKVYPTT